MTDASASKSKQTFSFTGPRMSRFLEVWGIIIVVVVMMVFLAAIRPEVFLTPQNSHQYPQAERLARATGARMYVVIVTAGIDLSVGSIMALGMVALAIASKAGVPWPIVLLIGPGDRLAVGFVNGIG